MSGDKWTKAWDAGEIDADALPDAWRKSEALRDHLYGALVRSIATVGDFSLAGELAEELGGLLAADEVQQLKTRLIAESGRELSDFEEEFEHYFGD